MLAVKSIDSISWACKYHLRGLKNRERERVRWTERERQRGEEDEDEDEDEDEHEHEDEVAEAKISPICIYRPKSDISSGMTEMTRYGPSTL